MRRKNGLLISLILFICAFVFGVLTLPLGKTEKAFAASHLTKRLTDSDSGFFIEEGASVRVNGGSYNENGLRYTIGMEEDAYKILMTEGAGFTDVSFGVLIAPASDKYVLTPESVFGLNGGTVRYDWAVEDENGNLTYHGDGTKTRIINIQTDKLFNVQDRSGDDYYFHGSIINVNKDNLIREFQGVGYLLFTYGGVQHCVMLSNETHIRSIVYVSQMAVAANSAHSAWLEQNYINAVSGVSAKYTEENYLEQEDGSFKLDEGTKKTTTSTINASVVLDTAPTFSGYAFDQADERNVLSGKVYVHDKLVLKRYYRLGYSTPALNVGEASTVTTAFNVSENQDKNQVMIENVGENYVAVTARSSTIVDAGFYAFAINLAGTANGAWNGDLTLQFTPNGWYLTSGNIYTDANRIVKFETALDLKNSKKAFTIVYKATYNGNEYYTNGMQLELWIAQHNVGADIKSVSFTRMEVSQILNSEKAKVEEDKLTIKYTALSQAKFVPDFSCMIQQGWNTSCSWEVKDVQILTSAPLETENPSGGAPNLSYEFMKPLNDNSDHITLIKTKYETEGAVVVDAIATDFGADPTGEIDSTAAIQWALDSVGGLGGGTVFLPAGKYLVTSTIRIPNYVSLVGDWNKPNADNTDADFDYGTVILAKPQVLSSSDAPQKDPLFALSDFSGMVGLTFYYVEQNAAAVKKYSYTIYGGAPATATLRNLTFLNSTYGIGVSLDNISNELINLENIYGTFLYNAVRHNATTDVGFYNNINVSSKYWKNASSAYKCGNTAALDSFIDNNLDAMILGDLDDQMLSNITIDGGRIGIKFTTGIRDAAGFWGLVHNAKITCQKGVYADYLNAVSGVVFTDSNVGIVENNSPVGCIKMSNSTYQKAGSGRIVQEGGKVEIKSDVASLSLKFSTSQRLFIANTLVTGGRTDNSGYLQAIVNSVGEEGGVVVVPNGIYRLDSSVVIPKNVELRSTQSTFTRSNHNQTDKNGVVFISYVSGATFVLKENAGVVGVRIWHAKNDFLTARDALNKGSYPNDISIKADGAGAYAYGNESVGAYVGYDFSSCDNHILKSNYGLSYVNFIKAGGKNGVITQCLANLNFMARSNIYTYFDTSIAQATNWRKIKDSGETGSDFAILRDELGKTHTKMVRLENAENQLAFNVFCYGHAGLFDVVNSTATLVNTSLDYLFMDKVVYELSGGACNIIGSLRVYGISLKVNSGVLKAYGRIAFGELKEKAYDSSVSLADELEYVSPNAKRKTLFNCNTSNSGFNVSLNYNSNYIKEGIGSWRWNTTTLEGKFTSVDISEYRQGYLHFYIYCSDISKIGTEGQIEITSSGRCDVNEYNWMLMQYVTKTGWNDVWLDLAGAGTTGGVADLTSINYLRIYTLNSNATFYIDNIEVVTD